MKSKEKVDRRVFLKNAGIWGPSMALLTGVAGEVIASEAEERYGFKRLFTRRKGLSQ